MRAWLPMPLVKSEYQKPLGDQWSGSAKVMKPLTEGSYGAGILYAEFAPGESAPVVELTSRVQTQDRALDWSKKIATQEEPGLLRSVGVPARDIYGIRVAPSAFGYKALGAGSANISKAQHCRAEVFLTDYGWVAMDPADVTKVAREETSEWLKVDHPLVEAVRPKLFGGWEGNWLAFNTAHDVALPNATQGGKLGFFMYPQSETAQ